MKIKNYSKEKRIQKDNNGVEFQHLADIIYNERSFVIYKVLNGHLKDETYIEERVNNKFSDFICGQTELVYVKEDSLWDMLFETAAKEGVFT